VIARIELTHQAQNKCAALSEDPAAYETLRHIYGETAPTGENAGKYYMWSRELLIDMDTDGPVLTNLGLTFEVKSFKGTLPLNAILPDGRDVKVYVQIPHIGLLTMNEVKLLENACTDALQDVLDDGWRILCVCPPNAARRPDYILGRTKPEEK
jgi:hypothetical protein